MLFLLHKNDFTNLVFREYFIESAIKSIAKGKFNVIALVLI